MYNLSKIGRFRIVAVALLLCGLPLRPGGAWAQTLMSVYGTREDRLVGDWLAYVGTRQISALPASSSSREQWDNTLTCQIPDILVFQDGRIYWREGALSTSPSGLRGSISYLPLRGNVTIYQGHLSPKALADLRRQLQASDFLTKPLPVYPPIPDERTQVWMGVQMAGKMRSLLDAPTFIPEKSSPGQVVQALRSLHPSGKTPCAPAGILIGAERRGPFSTTGSLVSPNEKSVPWPLKTPPPFSLVMAVTPFLYPTFHSYTGKDAQALRAVLARTNTVSDKGKTYHLFSRPAPPYYIMP